MSREGERESCEGGGGNLRKNTMMEIYFSVNLEVIRTYDTNRKVKSVKIYSYRINLWRIQGGGGVINI